MTTFRAEAPAVLQETRDTAWRDVVALERRSGQRLLGYALRLGIDRGRAADLVQEALLRLWRELDRGTPIASTEAWTFRALSRLAMDEHRLHRRVLGLVTRLGERDAVRAVEVDATDRVAVWVQVDRLPARQRQAIYLRYQADLDFEEVARVMGITAGTARSLVSQAMATLRMNLVNEAGET